MKIKDWFLSQETFDVVETDYIGVLKTTPKPDLLAPYYDSPEYLSHGEKEKGGVFSSLYFFLQGLNARARVRLLNQSTGGNNLLDVGCGAGRFLKEAQDNNWNISGVEQDAMANSKAQKLLSVDLYTSLDDVKEDGFDAITFWHVLEHVEDPTQALKQCYNISSSNATLILALPNYDSWDAKHYKEYWAAWDVPRHLYHFNQEGIKSMAHNVGWNLVRSNRSWLDVFYVSLLSEKYKGRGKLLSFILAIGVGIITTIQSVFRVDKSSAIIYIFNKSV